MKRPNKEDYVMSLFLNKEELHKAYEKGLEDYCDEIEGLLEIANHELNRYKKAFDKACSMIVLNGVCDTCQIECTKLREEDLINGECKWRKENKEDLAEYLLNGKKEK